MGLSQSKEQMLYQQVNYGNIEGIKALNREGARLEWIDNEGKTPLILACMRPDLLHVAKALLEMGANVNAYRPGSHAGTPLHHAAKKGLDSTVILLLSHGANPLVMNDDCQTPLELARAKGHSNVVRSIENHICLFSGWLREINGPSILEAFVPQWVSKKIWAVVLPCDSRNPTNPRKFELAIYPDLQVSLPRTVVALWKAQIGEPKFNQFDPALIIVDNAKKTKSKFLSAREGDKQQIQWFYNACRGLYQIPHTQHSNIVPAPPPPAAPPLPNHLQATNSPYPEDAQLAMAINASIQTALIDGVPLPHVLGSSNQLSTNAGSSERSDQPTHNENPPTKVLPNVGAPQLHTSQTETPIASHSSQLAPPIVTAPSAPPISDETVYGGPIQYPSIDSSPVGFTVPYIESKKDGGNNDYSSTCVICLDNPVEGACIPCGHMAGCMSCLKEIKEKRGNCPVCRAKIDQVVRLYAV